MTKTSLCMEAKRLLEQCPVTSDVQWIYERNLFLVAVRAALSQPAPEPPTDDQLNELWNMCGTADEYGHHEGNIFQYARAVLARWGRHD